MIELRPTSPPAVILAAVLLAVLLAGCLSHTRGGEPDAGPPPPIDGGPVISECEPQDARGEGGCEVELGWVWTGDTCRSISGCSCAGRDCGVLAPDEVICVRQHAVCPRSCGGIADARCLPFELCDFEEGSECGGDGASGVCAPTPAVCEPSRETVCGCDGREYVGECAARLAGTDLARVGPCVVTPMYDTAKAESDCAPDDGPAWRITLTTDRASCDEVPADGSLVLVVWHALESASPGTTYLLGGATPDGEALVCGLPGEPCTPAIGAFSSSVFAPGEVARVAFDVQTEDGRRFVATDVEIARWWCSSTFPGCG